MSFSFQDRRAEIARLVRTVASSPADWKGNTEQVLQGHYGRARFLCDGAVLRPLDGRANGIHQTLTKIGYFKRGNDATEDNQFRGGELSALVKYKPATLMRIVKISAALDFIAKHAEKAVRDVTMVADGAGGARCFTLPDNCVVPALYHADPGAWTNFRSNNLGLSRARASQILAGNGNQAHEYFEYFETGTKGQQRQIDYRVTKATAQGLYAQIQAHCTANNVDCPGFNYFFSDDPMAGAGNGEHTEPLRVGWGNRLA